MRFFLLWFNQDCEGGCQRRTILTKNRSEASGENGDSRQISKTNPSASYLWAFAPCVIRSATLEYDLDLVICL